MIRARLAARTGDASDAGWSIYLAAAKAWEEPPVATQPAVRAIATGGTRQQSVDEALAALRAIDLAR